jgi:hypothetical protein
LTASTSFTVRGSRNGSRVFVTWTDGQMSGDTPTIDLLEVEAEMIRVNPGDRKSWGRLMNLNGLPADPLSNPNSAYVLMVSVFDSIHEVEGDTPDGAATRVRTSASGRRLEDSGSLRESR